VTYILKKPTRARAGETDAVASGAITPAKPEGDLGDVASNASSGESLRLIRAHAAKEAFVGMYGRLDCLLGDRWTGALDRLRVFFPSTSSQLDATERRADDLAVAFIDGGAAEVAFGAALAEYEKIYALGAQLLAAHDRAEEGRCSECGRTNLTVIVRDDQDLAFCRACRSAE
jgi:hypothetical protein